MAIFEKGIKSESEAGGEEDIVQPAIRAEFLPNIGKGENREMTKEENVDENHEEVVAHPAVGAEIVPHCLPLLLWVDKSSHLKDHLINV